MSTQTPEVTRLTERWDRFRAGRNTALASEHGWLTLTSFQWLPDAPSTVDGLPGLWSTDGTTAALTAGPDDSLTLVEGGAPVSGIITATLQDEESLLWVQSGSVVVELGMRANRYMIRTRDSQSATLTQFTAVPVFGYNPELVFTGIFERYPEPREVDITTANPEVPGTAVLVGDVVFELAGTTYRLAAEQGPLGSLIVTFFDDTNNVSSSHWRKVELTRPRPDGTVTVDFNRAINYPSAFTDYGTCPAPMDGNRINATIEAGERNPR
ncbi:DUF1684 domain-containing protein [Arthrobacter livingstonensis]|uniref:DUF1684 domain-containing protein n=1 Tax=Arthrobacter livingstonensis TaxID=670078 RepID=A0A2V5LP20_9MICC|nr:DUF1684 domain-containing protein [Arthrobacter livingstonensis]PYI69700.1 DUF1684 domain-containing protein [Arthrobacter livingstonensis]